MLTVACVCAPLQFENFTLLWGTSQKASVDSHEVKREALNACKFQVRQNVFILGEKPAMFLSCRHLAPLAQRRRYQGSFRCAAIVFACRQVGGGRLWRLGR